MSPVLLAILALISSLFRSRLALQAEILALRHQLAIYDRNCRRPRIRSEDRILWSWLSRIWPGWRESVVMVQPATVIAWRRRKFREHWRRLSQRRTSGRPAVPREVRDLVRRISSANPLWGSPRIMGELHMIGIDLAKSTVEKYMVKRSRPPSPTWRAFLRSHLKDMISVDFFTVPTVRHHILFVFLVLAHERRRVLHFNVTTSPSAEWAAQQVVEALPWDNPVRYLLRDRDRIYGDRFRQRIEGLGVEEVLTSYRSPWQNPFVERLIGTLRRECLDHIIVLNESHLRRVLRRYLGYYHHSRTHLSLDMACPQPRPVQAGDRGEVVEIPEVFGLHHRYERRAA